MEKPQWRVRSQTLVIDSPWFRLRRDDLELPNGDRIPDYYIRESTGFVNVFALTPDKRVVVVHQYRYGIDSVTLELPAGAIDGQEPPLECAKRELREETGFTAQRWEKLMTTPAEPVRSNSIMHAYIAYDAQRTHEQHLDLGEDLEWSLVSLDQLRNALHRDEIGAVPSVAVVYRALERLRML